MSNPALNPMQQKQAGNTDLRGGTSLPRQITSTSPLKRD